MADQFDRATDLELLLMQSNLALHEKKVAKTSPIVATGHCLNCDEPLSDNRRWCNAQCRDEWQRDNPNL